MPEAEITSDLELIGAFAAATTLGDVRKHQGAWDITAAFVKYDEGREVALDVEALPASTPFEFGGWFEEEAFACIPQARLRSSQLCPREVMEEFGYQDDEIGMDYEPAPWLAPEDREAIEQRLVGLGYRVERRDDLIARYLDV
ncbi:hypothetical protein ASG91_00100 [Phycicoccus sp. Soil802]|nr:hypothetical protein ASG91_00100 [Phycicoccus sp. Soil802]